MRNSLYIPTLSLLFAATMFCSFRAQAQDCKFVSKYIVSLLLTNGGDGNAQSFYFEYYHPDESWDFMCEVDSILIKEVDSAAVFFKYTIDRNSNGDITEILYPEDGGDVLSGKVVFDWDYPANTVTLEDFNWENGQWVVSSKEEIDYHANGSLKEIREFDLENGQWVADGVRQYGSDANGNITTITYIDPDSGEDYNKIEYTYAAGRVQYADFYDKDNAADPWDLENRISYNYHGSTGIKTQVIYSEWNGNSFCDKLKLTFPNQEGYPIQIDYLEDTNDSCGQWNNFGTGTHFCWDSDNGRLLNMWTSDDDYDWLRYQLYYDGATGDDCVFTAAKVPSQPSPFDFKTPNPLVPGQNFSIEGLTIHHSYRATWLDLNGQVLGKSTHSGSNTMQMETPDLPSGMYLLHVQDMISGQFGAQKIIIQQ